MRKNARVIIIAFFLSCCQSEGFSEINPYTYFATDNGGYLIYEKSRKIDELSGAGHIISRYEVVSLIPLEIEKAGDSLNLIAHREIYCGKTKKCELGSGSSPLWLLIGKDAHKISRFPSIGFGEPRSLDGGDGWDLMSVSCIEGWDHGGSRIDGSGAKAIWGYGNGDEKFYAVHAQERREKCNYLDAVRLDGIKRLLKNKAGAPEGIKIEIFDARTSTEELKIVAGIRNKNLGGSIDKIFACKSKSNLDPKCFRIDEFYEENYIVRPRFIGKDGSWVITNLEYYKRNFRIVAFDVETQVSFEFKGTI